MNRRYGSDVSQAAINEAAVRPRPISLTPREIGAEKVPDADTPIDVEAWVRFPEMPVRVEGQAVAWTDRAACVEFTTFSGATHRT